MDMDVVQKSLRMGMIISLESYWFGEKELIENGKGKKWTLIEKPFYKVEQNDRLF